MTQLGGILLISWFILWLYDKSNLNALGFQPTKTRTLLFLKLFMVSSICSASAFLLKIWFIEEQYVLSADLSFKVVLFGIWEQFRSVLTEELMCRGALLYILIKKLDSKWAIVISAVFFALLHWLNAGVWGNILQMSLLFIFTFCMGLVLAFSFVKSHSIWLPFAIHFGWNLTQNFIFPDQQTGTHIFILKTPSPEVTVSYLVFFTLLLLPKISVLLSNYFILKKVELGK